MITEDLNLQDLTLEISNAFNDTGAYRELNRLLSMSITLSRQEIEELVDRLEAFITQEIQEIIDER
jgi:hypothetical protein